MSLIDGRTQAAALLDEVAAGVAARAARGLLPPGLAVVRVGDDEASRIYVGRKMAAAARVGLQTAAHVLPADTPQAALLALVARLNADPAVHGILVQLPLPAPLEPDRVLEAVDPAKDVDGFHPQNAGRWALGLPGLVPCTPQGCLRLLDSVHHSLAGLDALVVGRSAIVGRPMASLLLQRSATVTVAHSHTRDLPARARRADIVVAAVGRPGLVRGDWIKPGATVIDVGINRVPDGRDGTRLVGDVAFEEAAAVAGHITPVPGGVGPMTVACLMANTLTAANGR